MDKFGSLAYAVMLVSSSALAQQAALPPATTVPHAQPMQRELQQLPASERTQMTADLSRRIGDEVAQFYRQVMQESDPRNIGPRRQRAPGGIGSAAWTTGSNDGASFASVLRAGSA